MIRIEFHAYPGQAAPGGLPKVIHHLVFENMEYAAGHIPQIGGKVRYLGDTYRVIDATWQYSSKGTLVIVEIEPP